MREIKFDCLKLSENGATLKEIGKHMRIPKKKVLFLLGELTPSDLLKSSESKKVIVNKVNEGVSKVALAQELGLPCYKLQHWINEASAGRELSDDDAIHSDSENSRDTIRNAIFYYYQSNSKEAASSITKTEPNRIARWVNRFENDVDTSITIEPPPQKPQKKTLPSDVIDKNNSLIADFIKKSVS